MGRSLHFSNMSDVRLEFAFGDIPDLTIARRLSIFTHIVRQKTQLAHYFSERSDFTQNSDGCNFRLLQQYRRKAEPWLDADTNRSISLGVCAVALTFIAAW
jgi:hypothetical protein